MMSNVYLDTRIKLIKKFQTLQTLIDESQDRLQTLRREGKLVQTKQLYKNIQCINLKKDYLFKVLSNKLNEFTRDVVAEKRLYSLLYDNHLSDRAIKYLFYPDGIDGIGGFIYQSARKMLAHLLWAVGYVFGLSPLWVVVLPLALVPGLGSTVVAGLFIGAVVGLLLGLVIMGLAYYELYESCKIDASIREAYIEQPIDSFDKVMEEMERIFSEGDSVDATPISSTSTKTQLPQPSVSSSIRRVSMFQPRKNPVESSKRAEGADSSGLLSSSINELPSFLRTPH